MLRLSRFTPVYGALVLFPAPWNGVLVPFIPLFFFPRTAYKTSFYLGHVSYFLLLVFTIVLFTFFNLAIIPVAYCKQLHWLISEKAYHRRTITIIVWAFLGPAYLGMCSVLSYKVLIKYLYEEAKLNKVDMEPLKNQILIKLEEIRRGGMTQVPVEELENIFCTDDGQETLKMLSRYTEECFADTLVNLAKSKKLSVLLKFRTKPETVDVELALHCFRHWNWQQLQMADPYLVQQVYQEN
mmetsp:Transcript_34781/g.61221  ORF Transcript_34781/g.61221 Transcript_34781/m.61221 type:complete len:240 (+) Transcript_34781:2082-2801(+)